MCFQCVRRRACALNSKYFPKWPRGASLTDAQHTPIAVFYILLFQLVDTKEPDIQPSLPHRFTPEHNAANIKRNTHTCYISVCCPRSYRRCLKAILTTRPMCACMSPLINSVIYEVRLLNTEILYGTSRRPKLQAAFFILTQTYNVPSQHIDSFLFHPLCCRFLLDLQCPATRPD